LRILVVSQYFWPENFRVNDLVQEWVQRGHQVTVLTGIPNYPTGQVFDAYRQNPGAFARFNGARVIRVPMLPRGTGSLRLMLNYVSFVLGASLKGPWALRRMAFDVIFVCQLSPVTVGLPAVLLSALKRTPIVFWVLDLWPETLEALGVVRSPFLLRLIGRMVQFIYDRCALVLGQSRGLLQSIAQRCVNEQNIRYFPSWAEDVFDSIEAIAAPELAYRPDLFNVVFAGNIGEAQDIPAVLDAAEKLKDDHRVRWIIIGDGRKFEWLQAEVVKRGLQDQVLLPGRFPVERMPAFYAHADALLVSLKRDPVFSMTIPGKVQSYLRAGIALIGMLDGEGAAVIREANAGLTCAAGDSEGLAQAVLAMADMSVTQRRELGKNGQDYAQREFDRHQLMGRLEGFLQEAVSGSSG